MLKVEKPKKTGHVKLVGSGGFGSSNASSGGAGTASIEVQTAVAEVVKQFKDGAEEKTVEEVAAAYGPGPFANVGMRVSRTINLGDYNSVRVEVALFVPCVITEKEINDTYSFCESWVDDKMQKVVKQIESK